jgi:G3E family GTPase
LEHEEPIDEERLRAWLSMITTLRPYALLRLKGLIRLTTSERPLLLQAVGTQFSPPEWLEIWPGDLPRTQLVLIFKELSPDILKKSFHRHVLGQNSN